jgi:hypothetical protein
VDKVEPKDSLDEAVDMLAGHQQEIHAERDRKLEAAREQRKNHRQRAA